MQSSFFSEDFIRLPSEEAIPTWRFPVQGSAPAFAFIAVATENRGHAFEELEEQGSKRLLLSSDSVCWHCVVSSPPQALGRTVA